MARLRKHEQVLTLHRALDYVRDFSLAIDGGANYGDWTQVMAGRFARVHAFEPNADLFKTHLVPRFGAAHNVTLHHAALWIEDGTCTLNALPDQPNKVRGKFITPDGDIATVEIDSLNLPTCGLLKLDCEGADFHALQGAERTIKDFKPVVIVEVKQAALDRFGVKESMIESFLMGMGATEFFRMGPDRIYGWPST
jgi:FkbM family methyltransferase